MGTSLRPTKSQQKELEATVAQQQCAIETLSADLKDQAAQMREVTNALRSAKPVARVVAND